jgi:predicted nucleotidyltransferase
MWYNFYMVTQKDIDSIAQTIAAEFSPQEIVLFGSCAQGTQTADSDLDLLVIAESDAPRYRRAAAVKKVLRKFRMPLDIVVFTPREIAEQLQASSSFVSRIMATGRILFRYGQ